MHRLALKNPMTIKVLMATNFESGAIDESQADCEFADEVRRHDSDPASLR